MREVLRCTKCQRYMAWHVSPDTTHEGEKVYERQTIDKCGKCRRAELRRHPRQKIGSKPYVDMEDLVEFINWGYHPDDLARRFGYTDRENIYVRLRRAGRYDLKEKLIARVQQAAYEDRPTAFLGSGRDRRNQIARSAA